MLVAQSMLFAAYATVFASHYGQWFLDLIVFLGALLAIIWLCLSLVQRRTYDPLQQRLKSTDKLYREITEHRKRSFPLKLDLLVGYGIPILIVSVWVLVLLINH